MLQNNLVLLLFICKSYFCCLLFVTQKNPLNFLSRLCSTKARLWSWMCCKVTFRSWSHCRVQTSSPCSYSWGLMKAVGAGWTVLLPLQPLPLRESLGALLVQQGRTDGNTCRPCNGTADPFCRLLLQADLRTKVETGGWKEVESSFSVPPLFSSWALTRPLCCGEQKLK